MNGSGISFERSSRVFCAFLQHLSFFGGLCQAFNQTSNFKISRIFRGSRNFLTTGKTRNLARVQILPRYYEITERLLVVAVAVVVVADVLAVVIVAAAEVVVPMAAAAVVFSCCRCCCFCCGCCCCCCCCSVHRWQKHVGQNFYACVASKAIFRRDPMTFKESRKICLKRSD